MTHRIYFQLSMLRQKSQNTQLYISTIKIQRNTCTHNNLVRFVKLLHSCNQRIFLCFLFSYITSHVNNYCSHGKTYCSQGKNYCSHGKNYCSHGKSIFPWEEKEFPWEEKFPWEIQNFPWEQTIYLCSHGNFKVPMGTLNFPWEK